MFAYVGSRTTRERNARGEGISVFRCESDTGALEPVQVFGGLVNPSFLALNKAADRLYAVHGDCEEISAFAVDASTGRIGFLNRQSTRGRNPVHLALDPSERFIVVSNHLSSSLAVVPIASDGSLMPSTQLLGLEGEPGPHRTEQPFAKPHFNPFDPGGQFVLVPDKGVDRIFSFRFSEGVLKPAECPEVLSREGAGPRHIAFHPSESWAYVVNELDSTVTAYAFDSATGALRPFQVLSTLSDRFTGNSRGAEIEVHPSGRTLYASNRGEDTIAVFSIEPGTGRIALIQSMPTQGRTPRFFALSPGGRWLYVLNEESDNIVVLSVDAITGELADSGLSASCGSPVCMVFAATPDTSRLASSRGRTRA